MSIQVEMPKWYLAMNRDGKWFLYENPVVSSEWLWTTEDLNLHHICAEVKVTGYTGTWQDSLHQFIDGQWRKP